MANPVAKILFARSGNAGAAVRIDTRPKTVKPAKGRASYRRNDKHRRPCDD